MVEVNPNVKPEYQLLEHPSVLFDHSVMLYEDFDKKFLTIVIVCFRILMNSFSDTLTVSLMSSNLEFKMRFLSRADAHTDINTPETSPSGNQHGITKILKISNSSNVTDSKTI